MFETAMLPHRLICAVTLVMLAAFPLRIECQTAADHIALGDRDHAAMKAPDALNHFEMAIKLDPKSYEALWKATREAMDVSEYAAQGQRDSLYLVAEQYARRAVAANPGDAEGHFALARSVGKKALSVGKRERVRYAGEVRALALEALRRKPAHAGALHVMGMWNYNIMSLNGMTRYMARKFMGGQVLDTASWKDAQRYMEESVAAEPDRLVHRLDLARVYAARGDRERAREQYDQAVRGARSSFNDSRYQAEAAAELKILR